MIYSSNKCRNVDVNYQMVLHMVYGIYYTLYTFIVVTIAFAKMLVTTVIVIIWSQNNEDAESLLNCFMEIMFSLCIYFLYHSKNSCSYWYCSGIYDYHGKSWRKQWYWTYYTTLTYDLKHFFFFLFFLLSIQSDKRVMLYSCWFNWQFSLVLSYHIPALLIQIVANFILSSCIMTL